VIVVAALARPPQPLGGLSPSGPLRPPQPPHTPWGLKPQGLSKASLLLRRVTAPPTRLRDTSGLPSQQAELHSPSTRAAAGGGGGGGGGGGDVSRPSRRPAIVLLITAGHDDIADLKLNLGSLGRALPASRAPVLLFHEGDVGEDLQGELASVLSRGGYLGKARFHEVHFELPTNCCSFEPNWAKRADRGKFAYHNMIRFWVKDVWRHQALDEFDSVMRLDSDSLLSKLQPADDPLPGLRAGITYRGNILGRDEEPVIHEFDKFMNTTLATWPRAPRHPAIISNFTQALRKTNNVPLIYNNFFVSRVEFFRRPEVVELVDRMCCRAPDFYVYRYRWGDAFMQYFLLGMEAAPSTLVIDPPLGYLHGREQIRSFSSPPPSPA